MRLFRWYKANASAVDVPENRALTAWQPKDQSRAFGGAAWLTFAGGRA